jgi:integrase
MKKDYQYVKEGVRLTLFWNEKKQRWVESKGKKFEAKKTIDTPMGRRTVTERFRTMPEVNAWLQNTVIKNVSKKRGVLFKESVANWKEKAAPHIFISTREKLFSRLKLVEKYFGEMETNKIDASAIDEFLAHVKKPSQLMMQKSTRASFKEEIQALKKVLVHHSSRVDKTYRLPFVSEHRSMAKLREKKKKVKKDLSLDQQRAFCKALQEDVWDTKLEAIYFIAEIQYSEAARVQEIVPLEVEDIDFIAGKILKNKRVIWLRERGSKPFVESGLKNISEHTGYSQYSIQKVREWMMRSGVRTGPLFPLFTYRQICSRFDKALKKAGIPFSGTHLLRHAGGSEHFELGGNIKATQEKLGHRDIRSTQRYVDARAHVKNEIQARMDERLGVTGPATIVGTSGN